MKKFLVWLSIGVIAFTCLFVAVDMGGMERTYNGQNAAVSVYELQQDPESYDDSAADGAAAAIVQQNLAKTHAVNDVTSIVFDFRGYDTMGESFILILSVSGVVVLLKNVSEGKKGKEEQDGKQ